MFFGLPNVLPQPADSKIRTRLIGVLCHLSVWKPDAIVYTCGLCGKDVYYVEVCVIHTGSVFHFEIATHYYRDCLSLSQNCVSRVDKFLA